MSDLQLALLLVASLPGLPADDREQLTRRLLDDGEAAQHTVANLLAGQPEADLGWPDNAGLKAELASGAARRQAEQHARDCSNAGISLLFRGSADYPAQLKVMSDAPPVLFVRGNPELLRDPSLRRVAMVGTRKPTSRGNSFAYRSALDLAAAGAVIVSGLALGIDATVHRAALAAEGLTVAVLASGVDDLTPRSNASLGERIIASGAVVSEKPPGSQVGPWSFPERNRIIAGLSDAAVILEAGYGSGSRHTADAAREYGRLLLAMPGRPGEQATAGAVEELRRGECLAFTGADDVLSQLQLTAAAGPQLEPELRELARLIDGELPCRLDELPARLGLSERIPALLGGITLLKLNGVLEEDEAGYLRLTGRFTDGRAGPVHSD